METKILTTDCGDIKIAAEIIKAGGLVAFPTETVYGLGANALDAAAVKKIYEAKGRPSDNPMIVHIARASDIGQLTPELNRAIVLLIDNFWPGPLTLVVRKKDIVPGVTTGGLDTVAVRMPDDTAALALIREAGCPIAAPSANLSGKPSPTKAAHVIADLSGRADAIIAGGDCRIGIESTVLDLTGETPVILRPGMVTADDIEAVIGSNVELDPALLKGTGSESAVPGGVDRDTGGNAANSKSDAANVGANAANGESGATDCESADFKPKSPGMKYRHYAPKAAMTVIEGRRDKVKTEIERVKKLNEMIGNRVGVILFEEKAFREAAHDFFAKLRELDDENVDMILAGALSDADGVGFAVMNRMLKSAGYNIVRV